MRWYNNELMVREIGRRRLVGWEWMEMDKRIEWMDELLLFREEWNKSDDLCDLCDLVFLMKRIKE